VETVIDGLGTTFQELSSGGDSSTTGPVPCRWLSSEHQSYEPLVHLLNKIIYIANRMPRSQLSELRFHPFGGEVKDIYGSYKGLKPDSVGIMGELLTETEGPPKNLLKSPSKRLSYLRNKSRLLSNPRPQLGIWSGNPGPTPAVVS